MERLMKDYFGITPCYTNQDFERRFRMPRSVCERIFSGVIGKGIFVRRFDSTNKADIHLLQRVVDALRIPAYGVAASV